MLETPSYQSRGPTGDGRIKPDIQAPSHTFTAGSDSKTAIISFGGTSGASLTGVLGKAARKLGR